MREPILPGSAVGVLGSGQLGRMFALAAKRLGYRVHVFSPNTGSPAGSPVGSPAGQVADREWSAPYEDLDAAREFAESVEVVTLEFENIPVSVLEGIGEVAPVRPGVLALHTSQHRLREKTFLSGAGFPVAPYRAVRTAKELRYALEEIKAPAVLKTAGFGYDGKGQVKIEASDGAEGGAESGTESGAEAAWESLGEGEAVVEAWVDLEREVSVVGARGLDGSFAHYGAVENAHRDHILDLTVAPADLPPQVAEEAVEISRGVFEALEIVGTACVEFFVATDGRLLVNEIAPRPHNSGHWTIEGAATSQFEQQLRAVCGLPLGGTGRPRPAAMANLLGDLWRGGVPDWAAALGFPDVKLHLYGKAQARPGRKMGHLTALADDPQKATRLVLAAREALVPM